MQLQLWKRAVRGFGGRSKAGQAPSLGELRAAGDAARDRQDWAEAARFYEQVIQIDSGLLEIVIQLGHSYKEMGNCDRASELYFRALAHRPSDSDLHLQIGGLEKRRGNLATALHYYEMAVKCDPRNTDARREYQTLNERIGIEGSAVASFDPPPKIEGPVSALENGEVRPEDQTLKIPAEASIIANSSGLVARPIWVAARLPQDVEGGFALRVGEIEQFLAAPQPE